jgi:TrmH family RNA methyltransferase
LGAIVRSAVAFGTDTLLLSADCADLYNPKTLRAAMGSLFKIRAFIVEDLADAVIALRQSGRRVFAAELTENAVSLAEACPCTKDIFIIGNEGHGIPREISSSCDGSVYIPIKQGVESLNASVAASVLLWEQAKK